MSFNKLSKEELLRTLDEDFAFDLTEDEKKTKTTILAAITEGQLKFADYLTANPAEAEKYAPTPVEPVVEPATVVAEAVAPQPGSLVVDGVVLADVKPVVSSAPYLIKMTRSNPYYEVGPYRFSKDHPYQLVAHADSETVLREEGFRQAFPSELEEFYS